MKNFPSFIQTFAFGHLVFYKFMAVVKHFEANSHHPHDEKKLKKSFDKYRLTKLTLIPFVFTFFFQINKHCRCICDGNHNVIEQITHPYRTYARKNKIFIKSCHEINRFFPKMSIIFSWECLKCVFTPLNSEKGRANFVDYIDDIDYNDQWFIHSMKTWSFWRQRFLMIIK